MLKKIKVIWSPFLLFWDDPTNQVCSRLLCDEINKFFKYELKQEE